MAITRTPIIDDDGSGTTGTVLDNAWKQELYNQIDAINPGHSLVAHSAGNFTASPGSWTVTASKLRVTRTGNVSLVTLDLGTAENTVAGTPTFLSVTIPGLPNFIVASGAPFAAYVGGAYFIGFAQTVINTNQLSLLRDAAGTPFANGSYLLAIQIHGYH